MQKATTSSWNKTIMPNKPLLAHILITLFLIISGCKSESLSDIDSDGIADINDCAPEDGYRWTMLDYNSVDLDSDGYQANKHGQVCSNNTLPTNYFAEAVTVSVADCNDSNPEVWQEIAIYPDLDGDNIGSGSPQMACIGNTPNIHFSLSGYDCNDSDNTKWRNVTVYADQDGDGVGGGKGIQQCMGNIVNSGYSMQGYDLNDNPADPTAVTISTFDLPKEILTAIDSDADDRIMFQ